MLCGLDPQDGLFLVGSHKIPLRSLHAHYAILDTQRPVLATRISHVVLGIVTDAKRFPISLFRNTRLLRFRHTH